MPIKPSITEALLTLGFRSDRPIAESLLLETLQQHLASESPAGGAAASGDALPILVEVRGGLVQDITQIPPGITICVVDYDGWREQPATSDYTG